jgi:N utilization substance protein B
MGRRRKSRELAMQALFYMDVSGSRWQPGLKLFNACFASQNKVPSFFLELVRGVAVCRKEIDRVVEQHSSNWKISRMSCVDRNIMRIAVYELFFRDDIPAKVSINEAIDIGKKYGTEESGAFINGILDSIRQAMDAGTIEPPARPVEPMGEDRVEAGPAGMAPPNGEKPPSDHQSETAPVRRSVSVSPGVRKRIAGREKPNDHKEETP